MDLKETLKHARGRNRLTFVSLRGEQYFLCTDGERFSGNSLRSRFHAHCHELDIMEKEMEVANNG